MKSKKERVLELVNLGYKHSEIVRALKTDPKTIKKYISEENENAGDVETPELKGKKSIEAGDNTGSEGSEPKDKDAGSKGEKIEFVGGLKNMVENTDKAGDTISLCGNCNAEVKGTPKYCPHCGAEFEYEN